MLYHGKQGYVENTRKVVATTRWIEDQIRKTPGLFVYGTADTSVIGFGSKDFNILRLGGAMSEKGWNLSILQFPASLHLCVTLVHTKDDIAKQFIDDLRHCVKIIMNTPDEKPSGVAALYGTAQQIPDRSIIDDVGKILCDVMLTSIDGKKNI